MIGTILRLLKPQGMAGLALSMVLGLLLAMEWGEARHWKKQSGSFEQLYQKEQAAFATTVADYRQAAAAAQMADKANDDRVVAAQRSINERTDDEFTARLAAARTRADRLRLQPQAAADTGVRPGPSVSGLPAATGGAAQAADEGRLPATDALTATEQAIQLDELIKWVRAQSAVAPDPPRDDASEGKPPEQR